MCEQCLALTESWGEVLPGISLVRATRDGGYMKKGQWGLVRSNDADFLWDVTPVPDPSYGLSDDEFDNLDDTNIHLFFDWAEEANEFNKSMRGGMDEMHHLIKSCFEAGYAEEAPLSDWLFCYLGRVLEDNPEPLYPVHTDEQDKFVLHVFNLLWKDNAEAYYEPRDWLDGRSIEEALRPGEWSPKEDLYQRILKEAEEAAA